MVLGVGTDHSTLMQYRGNVLWVPALRMVRLVGAIQVPDHDDKITQPGVEQAGGKAIDRVRDASTKLRRSARSSTG